MSDENRRPGGAGGTPRRRRPPRADRPRTLAAAEAELAETKDKLLRALAESENQRRRAEREREESLRFAASNFAKELLTSPTICAAPSPARPRCAAGPSGRRR